VLTLYMRNRWVCVVTRARVYGAILQRRFCRPPRQQSIFTQYRVQQHNSPRQHAYQIHSACRSAARCHARRLPVAANLSCSWASFPCLMPKRPPSRWGKVASNLVSHLYLCSALVWSGSLAHGGRSFDPESLASQHSLEGLMRPPLIAIEPYSHSRHASNCLSHPTATSPVTTQCVVYSGWDVH